MLDTKIIAPNGSKQQQFEQAFIPQTDNKITPEQTLNFVAEKVLFYQQEVKRLRIELEKAETLARLHGTWLLELDRKQVTK
jgi:hypothetical protein